MTTSDGTPITIGLVVTLNSGGPQMTVQAIGSTDVAVTWTNADGDVLTAGFLPACLKAVA